jgi:hypothetical protein
MTKISVDPGAACSRSTQAEHAARCSDKRARRKPLGFGPRDHRHAHRFNIGDQTNAGEPARQTAARPDRKPLVLIGIAPKIETHRVEKQFSALILRARPSPWARSKLAKQTAGPTSVHHCDNRKRL